MRLSRLLATLPVVLLMLAPIAQADDTKDFLKPDNWEGIKEYWTVEGTSVTGHTKVDPKFNTFLCSKTKYSDFEMSFKIRLVDGKGNSGIQVRSAVVDKEKFVVGGPQADIGQQYWGSLYGERVGGMMKACPGDFVKKHVKATDFNDYFLQVKGHHVTIKINGETAVDEDFPTTPDKKPMAETGIIAFQLHAGAPMTVEYKDIKFVNLKK